VTDIEAAGDTPNPERMDFSSQYGKKFHEFYARRRNLPKILASLESAPPVEDRINLHDELLTEQSERREIQEEFFIILFLEHLQAIILQATLELVKFADKKATDRAMRRDRLIVPSGGHVRQLLTWSSGDEDTKSSSADKESWEPGMDRIHAVDPLPRAVDPEHLPPANGWQKARNILRVISHFIASDQSVFGFRVSVASFTVAILAYLHQTQNFFFEQRIIWAFIVLVIGMNPTSGATLFGFAGRIFWNYYFDGA
jgi:hypothetical protein